MEDNFRQDTSDQEDDDDTLSLSDLPIYGGGGGDETPGKNDLGVKEYTSSLSFEFFSEEWSSTILSKDSNDDHKDTPTVVFCGKVMPHTETPAVVAEENDTLVIENKKGQRKFGFRRLSLWNFNASTVSGRYVYESSYKDEVPVKRVSIVAAPRVKWYFYIFGLGRTSTKMHVGDLRRRQGSSTSKRSTGSGSVGGDSEGSKSSSDGGCGEGVGWWGLIRVLSCGCGGGGGDDHASTEVTATYGLAPRLGV